jgi:nucleoside-diphosphate-sugar epimerase
MALCLVTGGGGFLGSAITRMLLERGDQVRVLGRNRYSEVEALGAEGVQCDLTAPGPELAEALQGVDIVFHTAALAGMWGEHATYHRINVLGTRNILEAAREAGVKRFVHTSSPSVTFHGTDELNVREEDCSYPAEFLFHYPQTKAEAERFVLAQDSADFATTSLRPHLIYGPGDPHLLPRLMDRQRSGRLKVLGEGTNQVGITYVDNAAAAHVQASDALQPGSANAGKAYFVTDGEPVVIWDWLNQVFEGVGLGRIKGRVSTAVAMPLAGLIEWVWRTFGLSGEPPITRFTVAQTSTSHWYDLHNARTDFGYAPVVDPGEALKRTIQSLRS